MTSQTYSVIGDVAGELKTLQALWARLDPASHKILVGDLFDRGPDSKGVWEFVSTQPNTTVLYGNHEDFMVRSLVGGDGFSDSMDRMHWRRQWLEPRNGGSATLRSFLDPETQEFMIPVELMEWLDALPIFFRDNEAGLFVSHAPLVSRYFDQVNAPDFDKRSANLFPIIWERNPPVRQPGVFQVFGHNRVFVEYSDEEGRFAACIDDCANQQMRALLFPSMEYVVQPFVR